LHADNPPIKATKDLDPFNPANGFVENGASWT
jgi:hypothetical protein